MNTSIKLNYTQYDQSEKFSGYGFGYGAGNEYNDDKKYSLGDRFGSARGHGYGHGDGSGDGSAFGDGDGYLTDHSNGSGYG